VEKEFFAMLNITKATKRVSRIFASLILMTAQMTPFFVFNTQKVYADAGNPVDGKTVGTYTVNPTTGNITLTISGEWIWETHKGDCNGKYNKDNEWEYSRAVGYAIDWNDPEQDGHALPTDTTIQVGVAETGLNPLDNLVHPTENIVGYPPSPYGGCGEYDSVTDDNYGDWGPITHTYKAGTTTIEPCAVIYDVHLNKDTGSPKDASETKAGGTDNNKDNSVEENKDEHKGCFKATFQQIVVVKHVINDDDGAKDADEFTMNVSAVTASNTSFAGSETGTSVLVGEGAYSVDEDSDSGYTKTLGAGCSGTIAKGQTKICVITNDDVESTKLTLNKVVVNGDGGDADESDWTLEATSTDLVDPTNLSGPGAEGDEDVVSEAGFKPGTYTLTEKNGPDGYEPSDWECTNDITVNNQNQITLIAGDETVCTITNDDIAPTLSLVKKVVNGNGGSAHADAWTLIAQVGVETPVIDTVGTTVPDTDDLEAKTAPVSVEAGIFYTLSESTDPKGYKTSSWSCDGDGGTLIDGAIKLALAAVVTCTITNDDIAPKVTITKVVENTYGGSAKSSDFTLSLVDNKDVTEEVTSGQEYTTFDAGKYTVTESSELDNYELTDVDGDCVWDGDITLELSLDGTFSCTIINTQLPEPSISVEKYGPDTAHEGDTVTYTFYVTNNGNVDLTNIDVEDDIASEAVYKGSYGDDDSILEVGETWTYEAKYKIPVNQEANVVNTVTACGYMNLKSETVTRVNSDVATDFDEPDTCDKDDHELDVLHPEIKVVKSGPSVATGGSIVTYTFTVTNVGDIEISNLTAIDSIAGKGVYVSGDTDKDDALDLNETWIYTVKYTIPSTQTANVVNTVKVCGYEDIYENDNSELFVQHHENDLNDEIVFKQDPVCDEDSHTLTIPKVLGSTTVVTPKPQVLASTGQNQILMIISGISFAIITVWLMKNSYEVKSI